MGYWPLRTPQPGTRHASRLGENERGGTNERSDGSPGDGAQADREELAGRGIQAELIEDPKGAVEQELGSRLPEGVRVVALEESAETIYLVLPSTPMKGRESVELSDPDLESVAGGGLPYQYTGSDPRYPMLECNDDLVDPPE
jgi:hypothetical protein